MANPPDDDDLELREHPLLNAGDEIGGVPVPIPHPKSDRIGNVGGSVPVMHAEQVDHPNHYQSGHGLEVIDVIEHFVLGFHLGNTVKYILRAGRKGGPREALVDLEKARWYLDREIALRKQGLR